MVNNDVHFTLQGKGGVGKSFNSSIVAQYFMDYKERKDVSVADTDPVNASTARIKRLNAAVIEITENNTVIQSKFDPLFEAILANEGTFVVDNGASTFLPMLQYFGDNEVIQMLTDSGKNVFIHTIIVGGQAFRDTLQGYKNILNMVEGTNAKVVVWINEFQGVPTLKGTPIIESGLFENAGGNLAGVVRFVNRNSDAFDSDLKRLTEKSLTLKEAENDADFKLMSRSRLNRVFNDIYKQLDTIFDKDAE